MENIKVIDFIINEIDIISTHNILINNSDKLKLFASIRNSWPIFIIDEIFADDIFSVIILNQIPQPRTVSLYRTGFCVSFSNSSCQNCLMLNYVKHSKLGHSVTQSALPVSRLQGVHWTLPSASPLAPYNPDTL